VLAGVLRAVGEHDLPDRERDDQRVQSRDPDEESVDESDDCADAEAGEDPDRQTVVVTDAHADEHVPTEGDHAGRGQVDARLHDHEHLTDGGDREDRPVREDVGPRRALERAGGEERRDDQQCRRREPDREEAGSDERARDHLC
jgi:hypothetical protein